MLATTRAAPKIRGTLGEDPHTVAKTVAKDLTKAPRAGRPQSAAEEPTIECGTVEEALELANKRNRAVLTPMGYVCPSILRERR